MVFLKKQSSLVLRFVNNDFQENKEPTIGGISLPAFYFFASDPIFLFQKMIIKDATV